MLLRVPKGAIEIDQIVDEDVDWENTDDIAPIRLCFVYQSQDMQRLYRKYAPHLLLDASHKECMYSLLLYFLVVRTNVHFQLVAVIVLEDESMDLVTTALETIKS